MAMELMRDTYLLELPREKERTQMLLEGDVIVPDIKPDIATILRGEGSVCLEDCRVADTQVRFSGQLKVKLLYAAKNGEKGLCTMQGSLPFTDFITAEGLPNAAGQRMWAVLEHLEYRLLNERKVGLRAVITVYLVLLGEQLCTTVTGTNPPGQLEGKKGEFTANKTSVHKTEPIVVKAELPLGVGKPAIWEVLDTAVAIADREARPLDGKVQVKGNLLLSTLYTPADNQDQPQIMEAELPFHGYIEGEGIGTDTPVMARFTVDDVAVQVLPNEDGEDKVLSTQITLGTDLDVRRPKTFSYLEDAYSLQTPMDVTKEKITFPVLIGESTARSSVKDTLTLPTGKPDMLQIFKVWGNVTSDAPQIMEDAVALEGTVEIQLLYTAPDDNQPVQVVEVKIPYAQTIEVKGAKPGMDADVEVALETLSFQLLSPREAEVRATLLFDAAVTDTRTMEVITDIVEGETVPGKPMANVVLYVVQKGDTLWKIAKKYHTTVDALVKLNDIENPDLIYPGQRLLIIRRLV